MPHPSPSAAALLSPCLHQAEISLPIGGGGLWQGRLHKLPPLDRQPPTPLLIFMHGSSGLNAATRDYQAWLSAELGIATLAPDSFALPERPRYRSPAAVEEYEAVHRLRLAEIRAALDALPLLDWVDGRKLALAGSSEGAVAAARWRGREFAGRIVYSWTCEDNYFVDKADNGFEPDCALLNILSGNDPYFGAASRFNQGRQVDGDSRRALAGMERARLALLPDAPHTLYNLPAARELAGDFLRRLLG